MKTGLFQQICSFQKRRLCLLCDKVSCKIQNKTFQRCKVGKLKGLVLLPWKSAQLLLQELVIDMVKAEVDEIDQIVGKLV